MKRLLCLLILLLGLGTPTMSQEVTFGLSKGNNSLFMEHVLAQFSTSTARRIIGLTAAPATCNKAQVYVDVSVTPAVLYLCTDTNTWTSISTITASGGANTQVQYNCSGAFCGSNKFTFDSVTGDVVITGVLSAAGVTTTGPAAPWLMTNIAAPAAPASGKVNVYPDSTRLALTLQDPNGTVGFMPRVLATTNCTTEANCAAANEVDAAAGQQGTTETNFASTWSMPANFLFTNKAVQVCGVFELTTSGTAPTLILRFKAGSTELVGNLAAAPANSLTTRGFGQCYILQGTAAAGASVSVEAGYNGGTATWAAGSNTVNTVDQPVAAIATNGALTLQFSAQWGTATTGNTIQLHQLIIMGLN